MTYQRTEVPYLYDVLEIPTIVFIKVLPWHTW